MAQRPWLVPAAFILLGLIWGSSFMWIKIGVQELDPATLVAYRISLGALAMLLYVRLTGEKLPRTVRELAPMAALGMIGTALPFFLITWGEQYIDSGTAAVLNSLTPIFSLILAGTILRTESVTLVRVLGLVTGFAGAALLASREFALRGDPLALIGVAAVTVAAISYAGGASINKAMVHGTPRNVVAAGNLTFGAVYIWVFALISGANPALPTQTDSIIAVVWLGLLGSFFAFLLLYFLIAHLEATVATMVTYLFPVV
ncbi:MAG TPA: DMT family transporter, partial [Candidatus Limnocylindria bacterium]|nr:DMT family transporter [Candidatus Limnocylindria bacterium]